MVIFCRCLAATFWIRGGYRVTQTGHEMTQPCCLIQYEFDLKVFSVEMCYYTSVSRHRLKDIQVLLEWVCPLLPNPLTSMLVIHSHLTEGENQRVHSRVQFTSEVTGAGGNNWYVFFFFLPGDTKKGGYMCFLNKTGSAPAWRQ